ncbi:UDP-N-acetylmuramoyl-tripeptide--D-alanyl-D-alanine ligase [Breznakiella homolactica]|uniref:UDP-N-acetylmuramoyl-tripeptide--D-alanyl-D-alanine ligase n=1 Tax=Breznakiella homolactica TaxID=2798577 RepID=A0A7T8B7D4_9SPIR|nr:UDP-N-acetylmuramoyl-tripeptide--D-alanyl-D-alanine ligase [Breznakiella homolactica]QQO07399.1 UDP-N-acetylmuramoyl-tripeptide--D-alanyl-D-alanine ligase [Breznakiella homolactica]
MDDTILMTLEELAAASGAEIISSSQYPPRGITSVCIDSREVRPGALFVALEGSVQDGHSFAAQAFEAGAAAAFVCRDALNSSLYKLRETAGRFGAVLLAVPDTLRALQDAARVYLEKFPGLVRIGITGSSGKTTVKEIAAAMVGTERKTVMNPGNLNSETGLPLAVFSVRDFHEVGIFEMGMNRFGEMEELAAILKPRIALITNIGTAHIGILGTKDAIAKEKKSVFSQFSGTETALIPAYDEYAQYLAEDIDGKVVYFGPGEMREFQGATDLGLQGMEMIWEGSPVRFGLPGQYNLLNALAAAAIAREVPVSAEAIRRGLESVRPLFGRSEIISGPVTIIRDCYNANPEAVLEALSFADSVPWKGRRIYVIGSMLELGDYSVPAHEKIGEALASSGADAVYFFGEETGPAVEAFRRSAVSGQAEKAAVFYSGDMDELSRMLKGYVREGDLVLLKGSRGTALERLTDVLSLSPAEQKGACPSVS